MTLAEYLRSNDLSNATFAEQIGVDRATVGRWVDGISLPRKGHRRVIAEVTNGAVTAADFVADDDDDDASDDRSAAASNEVTP